MSISPVTSAAVTSPLELRTELRHRWFERRRCRRSFNLLAAASAGDAYRTVAVVDDAARAGVSHAHGAEAVTDLDGGTLRSGDIVIHAVREVASVPVRGYTVRTDTPETSVTWIWIWSQ